jgi:methylthioribose-1-phosphate isomerase
LCVKLMRTIEWDEKHRKVRLIDQRELPGRLTYVTCSDYRQIVRAVQNMSIRGAPAIGIAASFGLSLEAAAWKGKNLQSFCTHLIHVADEIRNARPTAVNLGWAMDHLKNIIHSESKNVEELRQRMIQRVDEMAEEDVTINQKMADFGARLIRDGDTIIHHCNTGSLATVDWGTALGAIRLAHEQGKKVRVLVDESRPRLQGSRLTAWELEQYGIPYEIITDNAAGYFLSTGQIQKVMFGADRVARNGDIANKVGSYMLALAAKDNNVPVYSVVPTSSIDMAIASGREIPIEQRDPAEVLEIEMGGKRVNPKTATALNPAFDITPFRLITAIVTEKGIVNPPFVRNLPIILKKSFIGVVQ